MRFEAVLKQEGGTVVCVENGATITITGKGDAKRYHPDRPAGAIPLPESSFTNLYRQKHFRASPAPVQAAKKGE